MSHSGTQLSNQHFFNINPFVPNAPFSLHPENIRKPYGFLMFSGVEKRCFGNKWVNLTNKIEVFPKY